MNLHLTFFGAAHPSRWAEVPSGMRSTTVLSGTNANLYLESRCAGSLRRTA